MASAAIYPFLAGVALLAEGVDRNFARPRKTTLIPMSPSSRRAWIEIPSRIPPALWRAVALLAEGVDRNIVGEVLAWHLNVALLAEGVDRNSMDNLLNIQEKLSPSARRATILACGAG